MGCIVDGFCRNCPPDCVKVEHNKTTQKMIEAVGFIVGVSTIISVTPQSRIEFYRVYSADSLSRPSTRALL